MRFLPPWQGPAPNDHLPASPSRPRIRKFQREGNSWTGQRRLSYDVADLDSFWVQGQFYEADQAHPSRGMPLARETRLRPWRASLFEGTPGLSSPYPHWTRPSRTFVTVRFHIPKFPAIGSGGR